MSENIFAEFKPIESMYSTESLTPEDKILKMKNYYEALGMTPNKYLQEYFNSSTSTVSHPYVDAPKQQSQINVKDLISKWKDIKTPEVPAYNPDNYRFSSDTTKKSKEFIDFFIKNGYTKEQASGIVGNLHAESGLITHRAQVGGGPGFGLAQWEGPRQADFRRIMKKDIKDSTDLDQLNFILWELNNTEKSAKQALLTAKTPEQAAEIFAKKYERMKTYNKEREHYARKFYE